MTATERQINNPAVACTPVGTPGMFTLNRGYPSQIFTMPGFFIHLAEADNSWRVVHTDGRPHKPADELEPLYNGDQTARWDGDTLVIDSISLDERTWINPNGWFHSDQAHVIERLRRPSRNYLEYRSTVEDPKVLTRPWTSGWNTYTLGSERSDRELLHQQREHLPVAEVVRARKGPGQVTRSGARHTERTSSMRHALVVAVACSCSFQRQRSPEAGVDRRRRPGFVGRGAARGHRRSRQSGAD